MTLRPEYQRAVCERLARAAKLLRGSAAGPSRRRLVQALLTIHVLTDDEFPADHRAGFRDIMAGARGEGSIEENVAGMTEDEVADLGEQIVRLHRETCEG